MATLPALNVLLHANEDLSHALLSPTDGGIAANGIRDLATAHGATLAVSSEPSEGFASLRKALEAGTAPMLESGANVVVLSIGDEVATLAGTTAKAEAAVAAVREDLVSIVQHIKDAMQAHILIANHSTVDPSDATYDFNKVSEDPVSLRLQRLALMLIGVSHETGISLIDIDRKIAELGAGSGRVRSVMRYDAAAAETISAEVVRILEDYGFFDDRSVMAQVGAKKK